MNSETEDSSRVPVRDAATGNELSLQEFISLLWTRKRFIGWAALCGLLAGLLFILIITPSYKAVAYLSPSPVFDLSTQGSANTVIVTPQEAFSLGLAALQSREVGLEVFRRNKPWFPKYNEADDREENEVFRRYFRDKYSLAFDVRVIKGTSNGDEQVVVSYEHDGAQHARDILHDLVEAANSAAVDMLVDNEQRRVDSYVGFLEEELRQANLLSAEINSGFLEDKIAELRLQINTIKHRSLPERDLPRALYLRQAIEVPHKAAKPVVSVILGLGILAGSLFGVTAVLMQQPNQDRRLS